MSIRMLISCVSILFIMACAKQGMPPGGPEDRIPPQIIHTIPDSNAVRIPLDQTQILFTFDETVQPSALDAVFVTPFVEEEMVIKLGGKSLSIELPDSLLPNTTYVITLGTGIKDYRNNALKQSYTLAFSTGDSLDRGMINGRILGIDDGKGIDVWAYKLDSLINCNPAEMAPDYIVQCTQTGDFVFSHMTAGKYRLFSVRDRVLNRLYDKGIDLVGIGSNDIDLINENEFKAGPVFLQMAMEDTIGPRLLSAIPRHKSQVALRFDESVQLTDSSTIVRSLVSDSVTIDTISTFYIEENNTKIIHIVDDNLETNNTYRIEVQHIYDLTDHPMQDDARFAEFESFEEADTTKPTLVRIQPKPGQRDVHPDSCIQFLFNEPMDTVNVFNQVTVSDTSDSILNVQIHWSGLSKLVVRPIKSWEGSTLCKVTLSDSSYFDLSGNSLEDSTFTLTIINPDTLSEISGEILRCEKYQDSEIVLNAVQLSRPSRIYELNLGKSDSEFSFKKLMPGKYVLKGYYDLNEDNKYTHGTVWPYQPSEPFYVVPDTILARSRWPNEGNQIKF